MNATVRDAMLRFPKVRGPATTVADVREQFRDEHVHAVLDHEDGHLLAVVERADIEGREPGLPARCVGRLPGRTIGPDADLESTRQEMADRRRRRLAVVDEDGVLLGLLCLKRTGRGFCTDEDVCTRSADARRGSTERGSTV